MEQLKEENHKLMLKLENLKKSHATEVEYIKEEQEIKEKEFQQQLVKIREESKVKEELKKEKIQALTEELSSLRDENDGALSQVERYKVQLESLKQTKTTGIGSSYSEYEGLKESQRTLNKQLQEKDELLTSQTEKIRLLGDEVRDLRVLHSELSEEVEGKDSIIKELNTRVKDLEREKEEECGGLQHEVLALKDEIKALRGKADGEGEGRGGGGGARGNSLFSEVEERRIKVEGELTRLRNMVKRLQEENRNLKVEVDRGGSHSTEIALQLESIAKSEHDLAVEIKRDKSETLALFDSYRDRFDKLRDEYTRKLTLYKSNNLSYHSAELETLRKDRDNLQLIRITMERELNELKRELKYNKHLRANAEANTKIVKANLDLLKQQQKAQEGGTTVPAPDANANLSDIPEVTILEDLEEPKTPIMTKQNQPLDNRPSALKIRKNEQDCKQQ